MSFEGVAEMQYRLLVADIDGTLVRVVPERQGPGDASRPIPLVPAETLAAIREIRKRGVRFLLATGRMWASARRFFEMVEADPPAILYNGAMVYDFATGEVLYRRHVPLATARSVLSLLRSFPEVQPHVYVDDRVYVGHINWLTEEYQRKDSIPVQEVGDLLEFLEADPVKILIIGERAHLEQLAGAIRRLPGDPVNFVFSEPTYLEVLPPGTSKGSALQYVAGALGIPREAIVAVGDDLNDLEMIRYAGLGVAMADAPEGLRAEADYVCATVEEGGLKEVIERFLLGGSRGLTG